MKHNPSKQAIVFVDTWWWAQGPSGDDVRGSSAAGLAAIAEPRRLEVDPGDGSGEKNCPWSVTKSDACTHTYERASTKGSAKAADGSPAYPARGRLVYDVRFENDGASLEVPGLPDSIESEWQTVPVRVTERQAVIVD